MIDIRLSDNLELMAEMQDNTVDLIYCDILYGTGRKFKDYQDLKPKHEVIEEHYIPRIKEMHRILKDTGSIYLQMDTRINHWIRFILDNIFGYDMFLNEISWCYGAGGSSNKKPFATKHDVILCYTKKEVKFNQLFDEKTGGKLKDYWLIKSIADKSGYLKCDDEDYLYFSQKPKKLIERIIKASSNENDNVLIPFAGSGSECVACDDLKRNWIAFENDRGNFSIAEKRVEKNKRKRLEELNFDKELN